jgi:curved DNA-binding protein CbpA
MPDPYQVLGVSAGVSDAELRAAYRRLVRETHPDHNGGSVESARRFEAVQEAYTQVLAQRRNHVAAASGSATAGGTAAGGGAARGGAARGGAARGGAARGDAGAGGAAGSDPDIDVRLANLERELRTAQAERERARRAAQQAARAADAERAAATARGETERRYSEEELGYIATDDSFSKIFSDAATELSGRLDEARQEHPVPESVTHRVAKSVSDLIDDLGSKLTGERHKPDR